MDPDQTVAAQQQQACVDEAVSTPAASGQGSGAAPPAAGEGANPALQEAAPPSYTPAEPKESESAAVSTAANATSATGLATEVAVHSAGHGASMLKSAASAGANALGVVGGALDVYEGTGSMLHGTGGDAEVGALKTAAGGAEAYAATMGLLGSPMGMLGPLAATAGLSMSLGSWIAKHTFADPEKNPYGMYNKKSETEMNEEAVCEARQRTNSPEDQARLDKQMNESDYALHAELRRRSGEQFECELTDEQKRQRAEAAKAEEEAKRLEAYHKTPEYLCKVTGPSNVGVWPGAEVCGTK